MAELAFSQSIPPLDVSFRHIQDLVYFVGDDPEKRHFLQLFLADF
jgi:hypothetical protein